MGDLRTLRRELTEKARDLHQRERQLSLASVLLIGELERLGTSAALGLSTEQFIALIGLTPSVYWKRAKAARVLRAYPEVQGMLERGETSLAVVALLYPKLTPANAPLLLGSLAGRSKREVEGLLSRVTLDGRLLEQEPEVELRLVLKASELALLERAREVLSAAGHVPSTTEVLTKALADLLRRRDPLRKAERAAARQAKRQTSEHTGAEGSAALSPGTEQPGIATAPHEPPTSDASSPGTEQRRCAAAAHESPTSYASSPGTEQPARVSAAQAPTPFSSSSPGTSPAPRMRRPAIPAAVRHAVYLRDRGQCTEILADGTRCPERAMLELNHRTLYCRGGQHTETDLDLRCRHHNQAHAEKALGPDWLVPWAAARTRAYPASQ